MIVLMLLGSCTGDHAHTIGKQHVMEYSDGLDHMPGCDGITYAV